MAMDAWGTFQITYATPEQAKAPEQFFRFKPTYEKFKAYRAEVLEAALFIESRLDVLLCAIFVGADEGRRNQFQALVLQPECCTTFQKWKMLREAMAMNGIPGGCLNEAERKSFLAGLQTLISDRNQFAHGTLFIDVRDGRALIQFFEGKAKVRYLSEDAIRGILKSATMVHVQLEKLIAAVQ